MSGSEQKPIRDRVEIEGKAHDNSSQDLARNYQRIECTNISCGQEIMRLHKQLADLRNANKKLQEKVLHYEMRNEELEELNTRDVLTGAFNRRFLENVATKIIAREVRKEKAWGALFVDVDDFKNVNDTYGHKCGDEVLKNITQMMREVSRDSDFIVRTGGDEFLIIMLEVHERDMPVIAERYMHAINATVTQYGEHSVCVTVSIGACFVPGDGLMDLDQVLINADRSLYKAKSRGKARIVQWTERRKKSEGR